MTNEQRISIERSLEKFKELRKTLGPDASVDQKRYLEEMISMGERALDSTVFRNRTTIEQTSPFSLSWQRVGKSLLVMLVVAILTLAAYAFWGWV